MKALAKERDRRYETAIGFARDIERFLNHEPVAAGPPSAGYRLRKFVRRNRGQVIAASLVLLALLAGLAGTGFGLMRAERQRLVAERAAVAERLAKQEAEARREEAERQQRRAEAGEKLASERLVQVEAEKKKTEEEKKVAVAVKDFLQNKLLGQADVRTQADALLKAGGWRRRRRPTRRSVSYSTGPPWNCRRRRSRPTSLTSRCSRRSFCLPWGTPIAVSASTSERSDSCNARWRCANSISAPIIPTRSRA